MHESLLTVHVEFLQLHYPISQIAWEPVASTPSCRLNNQNTELKNRNIEYNCVICSVFKKITDKFDELFMNTFKKYDRLIFKTLQITNLY